VARANIRSYRNPQQVCHDIHVVLGDAATYQIPEEPLVLYFYNPFGIEVKRQVVDNVRRSLEQNQRPITVIDNFYSPELDRPWGAIPSLQRVVAAPDYSIYKTSFLPEES
jgi:hypothetical protein